MKLSLGFAGCFALVVAFSAVEAQQGTITGQFAGSTTLNAQGNAASGGATTSTATGSCGVLITQYSVSGLVGTFSLTLNNPQNFGNVHLHYGPATQPDLGGLTGVPAPPLIAVLGTLSNPNANVNAAGIQFQLTPTGTQIVGTLAGLAQAIASNQVYCDVHTVIAPGQTSASNSGPSAIRGQLQRSAVPVG